MHIIPFLFAAGAISLLLGGKKASVRRTKEPMRINWPLQAPLHVGTDYWFTVPVDREDVNGKLAVVDPSDLLDLNAKIHEHAEGAYLEVKVKPLRAGTGKIGFISWDLKPVEVVT